MSVALPGADLHHTDAMTVRITVSLPDNVHSDLVRIAEGSNISVSAVIRTVLSDTIPRMTSVLEFLGNVSPADAPALAADLDVWAASLRDLMHNAPESFGSVRTMLDAPPEDGDPT